MTKRILIFRAYDLPEDIPTWWRNWVRSNDLVHASEEAVMAAAARCGARFVLERDHQGHLGAIYLEFGGEEQWVRFLLEWL